MLVRRLISGGTVAEIGRLERNVELIGGYNLRGKKIQNGEIYQDGGADREL